MESILFDAIDWISRDMPKRHKLFRWGEYLKGGFGEKKFTRKNLVD
jgi:hypothetical protein